jgi:hypothetical protein
MVNNRLGGWAFVIGLVLAIIIAMFGANATWPVYVLAVLGLIVGLLNVTDRETLPFLIAAIAFLLTFGTLGSIVSAIPGIGGATASFFGLVTVFIAPAAAVVAFKALFEQTRNK